MSDALLIGDRVRLLRQANGWTPVVGALTINIGVQALALIETNRKPPTTAQLIRLAGAFNVTTAYLQGTGDRAEGLDGEPGWLILRRKLETLTPAKRREVIAIFAQAIVAGEGVRL